MTFRNIIDKADSLFPNMFSLEEKMGWLNELSALIYIDYIKNKKVLEKKPGERIILPPGITKERICSLFIDGVKKEEPSSFDFLTASESEHVIIEYIDVPEALIDENLPVSAPYDNLFLYFLLAKICLHMEDAEGYNNYMSLYNELFNDYKLLIGSGSGRRTFNFKNLW
ncbi:MAG: hypothetical protein IJB70_11380 [Clostridia bacterium]|nr:hypothetical protein [Clostridia bacterium]